MYEMSPDEVIKELRYLQDKKNAEFDMVTVDSRCRVALNYAIKAVNAQKNSMVFCPHCGTRLDSTQ
jgi:hypothetical protein